MKSRILYPHYFSDDILCLNEPLLRLFYMGLRCTADRAGRLVDRPYKLRAIILPYDSNVDGESMISVLANLMRADGRPYIVRYEVKGQKLIQITAFVEEEQVPTRERQSVLPEMPLSDPAVQHHLQGDANVTTTQFQGSYPVATVHVHGNYIATAQQLDTDRDIDTDKDCDEDFSPNISQLDLEPSDAQSKHSDNIENAADRSEQAPLRVASKCEPLSERYKEFKSEYPYNMTQKDDIAAWNAFRRLKPDDEMCGRIMSGLERWKCSKRWTASGGAFIKSPANFLKERFWESGPTLISRPSREGESGGVVDGGF